MKLSTRTIIRLVDALQHFDVKPPEQDGKPLRTPYKLAGTVRMAMAKNIARLGEAVDAYKKARNALIYEHGEGSNTVPQDKLAEFEQAHEALLDLEHDSLNLIRFKEELLQLEANEVPVHVLAALMPIMLDAGDDMALAANANDTAPASVR